MVPDLGYPRVDQVVACLGFDEVTVYSEEVFEGYLEDLHNSSILGCGYKCLSYSPGEMCNL